ncbi:comEC/Rec2 family protein [Rickettsia endosymbiont of Ixodes pacificus]|uniref:hypothetical protein n=1 Tax=Rickettsia endosymbiont of Ixodes pacificus TaxID=1133329 RepID=UPI0005F859C3|nr:hypothetical protein [Rickettsia endosymbiont of Ixodes pacificus]KJW02370.1 comEC/Rec2 family protein [Rickettsia endosymbiont of Ixodes pacificus]
MLQYFKITLEAEYNNLNIWYFISFIYGIIVYFSLDFELSFTTIFFIFCVCLILTFTRNSNVFLQFTYWTNWFGQKDSAVLPLEDNIFITNHGQKIVINKNNHCEKAEIHINLNYKSKCRGSLITINKDFFKKSPVILIFCNKKECTVKS